MDGDRDELMEYSLSNENSVIAFKDDEDMVAILGSQDVQSLGNSDKKVVDRSCVLNDALKRSKWKDVQAQYNSVFSSIGEATVQALWCAESNLRLALLDCDIALKWADFLEEKGIDTLDKICLDSEDQFSDALTPIQRNKLRTIVEAELEKSSTTPEAISICPIDISSRDSSTSGDPEDKASPRRDESGWKNSSFPECPSTEDKSDEDMEPDLKADPTEVEHPFPYLTESSSIKAETTRSIGSKLIDSAADLQHKKPYYELLIDRSSDAAVVPKTRLMNSLRYRMRLPEYKSARNRRRQNDTPTLQPVVLYDILAEFVEDFDAAGRVEIFRLLLERNCPIPVILPNKQQHLPLLRLLNKTIGEKGDICLGDDTKLLRVAIISCQNSEGGYTADILQNVFNINSLHQTSNSRPSDWTAGDIALGCVRKLDETNNGSTKETVQHVLVLHVVGDFDPLWDFITSFSDCLIIEDSTNEGQRFRQLENFSKYKGNSNGLEGISNVLVWNPCSKYEESIVREAESDYGFRHELFNSSLCKDFYSDIILSIYEAIEENSCQERRVLNEMQLPAEFLAVDCPIPWDIDSIVNGIDHFGDLRNAAFFMQKSACERVKLEEKIKSDFQDENKNKQVQEGIREQKQLCDSKALELENHPLLQLLKNLTQQGDPSKRVLGIRQLEKALSNRSEEYLKPLRLEVERSSSELAELSKKFTTDHPDVLRAKDVFQNDKRRLNATVVNTEHLWREWSLLYNSNSQRYHELPELAAKHLLDGLPLELVDGDCNMVNLSWISATLRSLENLIGKSKRIFVLSVTGVQSCGKSTLLNTMFGVQMKTSVGQCTRGINMQLIPVMDRSQYDYILLLDTGLSMRG